LIIAQRLANNNRLPECVAVPDDLQPPLQERTDCKGALAAAAARG